MFGSTDLDILVSLGYSQELSRRALAATKGDRKAALELIKNNRTTTTSDGWKTDAETDWVRLGINSSSSLPKDAAMRALWKTPISVHIGSYRLSSAFCSPGEIECESVVYRCRVITHTADWICEKTYRDFEEFKHSLPFGTTLFFKTAFPYPLLPVPFVGSIFKLGGAEIDINEAEKRRQMLDEWMRELTMSEKCMSNADVLQKVRSFVAADKTKPLTEAGNNSTSTTVATTPSAVSSISVAKSSISPLSYNAIVDKQPLFLTIKRIRKFLPSNFPVIVAQLDEMLTTGPFRLDVADFKETCGVLSTIDDNQLRKDLSRDRIVVNGRRFQGGGESSSSFQEIVDACSNTVIELMSSVQLLPLASPSADSETFVKSLLRQLSRTESAFLSLCLLNTIVDIPGSSEEGSNIVLVPEAMLAEPMQLTIELLERKPTTMSKTNVPAATTLNREYCIDCELNTSTVYRFCDDMTMSTLLQCRVVYSKRVYGMLGGTSLSEKAGPSHVVFIRETKTTARDWSQQS